MEEDKKTEVIAEEKTEVISQEEVAVEAKEVVEKVVDDIVEKAVEEAKEVVEEVKVEVKVVESTAIQESNGLTEDQKKLIAQSYETLKQSTQSFLNDTSIDNTIKITKILGQVIKQLEGITLDGKNVSGADKKVVAIELGRQLIKDVIPDETIISLYDLIAEPTLEAMIDVSKVVNVVVEEQMKKCCPNLCTPKLISVFKKIDFSKLMTILLRLIRK